MNIEKKIWVTVTLLIIVLIPVSFAYWYWNSTTNTNVSFTINGVDVTYVGGSDITGANLIPVSSKEVGISKNSAIEKVVTASSTQTTYMNLYLTLETLPDGLKDKNFVYEVYNGANLVGKGNFASYNQGDKVKIANAQTITSSTTSFQLYIWIDGNVDNPSSMMNQSFKFVLSADATDYNPSQATLTKLGVTVNNNAVTTFGKMPYVTESELTTLCSNIEYDSLSGCLSDWYEVDTYSELMATGKVSTVNDNGVFATEDDLGTAYYYRGNVENNYVYFANAYWRIMRINGDGTIRMIYDGSNKSHNGVYDEDKMATSSMYNEDYDDNAYVGYMYGTPNSDYTNTHKNTTSSTIKQVVDKWYEDTIIAGGYDKYIADAIYCNDRKVTTGTYFGGWELDGDGTGITETEYETVARMYGETVSPTLKCPQDNDKFSKTAIGNGNLTYSIGLPTTDELVMAGYTLYDYDNGTYVPSISSYAYTYDWFWTMSPSVFFGGNAFVWDGEDGIADDDYWVIDSGGVRPVVSLKSDTPFSSGDGSYNTPFVVG